jgi:hypothetical protein
MMWSRLLLVFLLLLAGIAQAQEVSTVVVPVVGSVFGAGMSRWKTDVEVYNGTAFPTDVVLELSTVAGAFVSSTLAPGERQVYPDIVAQAFGQENGLSPLRITSERPVIVRAFAYAIHGGERSAVQSIDVYYRNAFFRDQILDGLAFSEAYRTNIGLVNFSEGPVRFVLALQRIPGRILAVTSFSVEPGSLAHASIQSLFPLITEGSGFSVIVESTSPDTYVYGSVITSETNEARFITPRIGTR